MLTYYVYAPLFRRLFAQPWLKSGGFLQRQIPPERLQIGFQAFSLIFKYYFLYSKWVLVHQIISGNLTKIHVIVHLQNVRTEKKEMSIYTIHKHVLYIISTNL